MGIFDLFAKGAGQSIAAGAEGIGTGAATLLGGIRELVKGKEADPEKLAELELEAAKLESAAAELQGKVNAIEAASPRLFVAGWRPFIGWVGGLSLAYAFLVRPILAIWFEAPDIDAGPLWTIIIGMLGLGGLRTYEKQAGVQDRH